MHPRTLAALLLAHGIACTSGGDDTGAPSSGGTTGEPGVTTTTAAQSTGDDTTGGLAYCHGWQTDAGEPYLALRNKEMEVLADGATLPLECGGQGTFMFGLYAEFGGFMPASDYLDFAVIPDVAGHDHNPDGHFYSADPVGYFIGCQAHGGGGPGGFVPIFPLDDLDDLAVLDGKPADIHVVMRTIEGDVTVDLSVVLAVQKDDSWGFCGG